ncbi:MAG TPA: hypothetical protein VM687_05195 [Stenotrophomonas sp.]|nr:hypothetical protein [Stenotrophomonas sp.]
MTLSVAKQRTDLDTECLSQPPNGRQTAILAALLNVAQLRAMHADDVSELFLTETQSLTPPPNGSSKSGKGI